MKVFRTHDMDSVAKILNHPKVYNMVADDSVPFPYDPPPGFWVMNEDETGVVRIDPLNGICCIVHIAAHPNLWGRSVEFVESVLEWGLVNTGYSKVIAMIPEYNKLTMRLCLKCGFEQEGRIKKSILKNWKFHDQLLFGLNKTDFLGRRRLCHQ